MPPIFTCLRLYPQDVAPLKIQYVPTTKLDPCENPSVQACKVEAIISVTTSVQCRILLAFSKDFILPQEMSK